MRLFDTAMAGLIAAVHFAFLAYLPTGGFLALRWRRSIWVHATAVAWAAGSVAADLWCPLTALERWARARAGMPALDPAGFIDHYITGVWYPHTAEGAIRAAALSAVAMSWLLYALTSHRRDAPSRSA